MTPLLNTDALIPPLTDAAHARVGLWEWDIVSSAVRFDAQWATLLGEEPVDMLIPVGEWMARIHPDDVNAARLTCLRHLGGHTDRYEGAIRVRHRDGTWRRMLDQGRVVERDAHGTALRMIDTHSDVTEQRPLN
jgi:two-component system, sensor histidine kinase and response regulator